MKELARLRKVVPCYTSLDFLDDLKDKAARLHPSCASKGQKLEYFWKMMVSWNYLPIKIEYRKDRRTRRDEQLIIQFWADRQSLRRDPSVTKRARTYLRMMYNDLADKNYELAIEKAQILDLVSSVEQLISADGGPELQSPSSRKRQRQSDDEGKSTLEGPAKRVRRSSEAPEHKIQSKDIKAEKQDESKSDPSAWVQPNFLRKPIPRAVPPEEWTHEEIAVAFRWDAAELERARPFTFKELTEGKHCKDALPYYFNL